MLIKYDIISAGDNMDCLFCKIIKKEIPAKIIYEDDNFIAFLDINPISDGHTLIVTKEHILDSLKITDELYIKLNKVKKDIINNIDLALKPNGFSLSTNIGSAQEIKHYHLHIIPQFDNNTLSDVNNIHKKISKSN